MTRRNVYLALWAAWLALTFLLTSLPDPGLDLPVPGADKLEHAAAYAVTGFLFALWRRESGADAGRAALHALAFAAAAGALDEAHQLWIPGRFADPLDWLADAAGGGAGALLSVFLPRLVPFLVTE